MITKNEMAITIVQAVYNLEQPPGSDCPFVKLWAQTDKRGLKKAYFDACRVILQREAKGATNRFQEFKTGDGCN